MRGPRWSGDLFARTNSWLGSCLARPSLLFPRARELVQAPGQRAPIHAQEFSGLGGVTVEELERPRDVPTLELLERHDLLDVLCRHRAVLALIAADALR